MEYGELMSRLVSAIDPLLDTVPLHVASWTRPHKSFRRAWENRSSLKALLSAGEFSSRVQVHVYMFTIHACNPSLKLIL